jgi:CheY-like chemotaxis protein
VGDRPLVLITEDDDAMRAFLDATLRRAGMATVLAANGREALDHLEGFPVDVLLLDMHMPVLDGLSTLSVIRASDRLRTLPVILVTGSVEEADRIGGLDSGAEATSQPVAVILTLQPRPPPRAHRLGVGARAGSRGSPADRGGSRAAHRRRPADPCRRRRRPAHRAARLDGLAIPTSAAR